MSAAESEKNERILISIIGAVVGTMWAYAFVTHDSWLLALITVCIILAVIIAAIRGTMRRASGLAQIKNTCQHCGHQRIDNASNCPECGVKFPR